MQKILCFWLLLTLSLTASGAEYARSGRLSDLPAAAQSRILDALGHDMPWLQLAELTASEGTKTDGLGWSIAIDGNTVVVGAPFAQVGNNSLQGAAYIFVRPRSGWKNMTQKAKLTSSDGKINDQFGLSVVISGDTIIIGNANVDGQEGTYVFVRPPNGWKAGHETVKLTCGALVAIRGDLAACASGSVGAVYVKPKNGWKSANNYDALLVTTDGSKNFFSSISTSGDVVVIGAADSNNESNVAYLYVKPKRGWQIKSNPRHMLLQTAKLTNSDSTTNDQFGLAVAIGGDTVAVGAPAIADNNGNLGAAYVFVKPTSGWTNMTETAKLTADTTDSISTLGYSVALRGDTLVAGNPSGTVADNAHGEAYVFIKPTGGWTTTSTFDARLAASDGEKYDNFGNSVSLSGTTVLVGSFRGNINLPGAAYVFGH